VRRIHTRNVVSDPRSPSQITDRYLGMLVFCGRGDMRIAWTRVWNQSRLFQVASPSLLNFRPFRSIGDLRYHVRLHADGLARKRRPKA